MAAPNIDKLSYRELLDLQDRIAATIEQRKKQEKADVKRRMMEIASQSGFDLDELMGGKKGSRKGSKVAPKYRHPNDPTLTWTGRGRQPLWLAAELKKGRKLTSFKI